MGHEAASEVDDADRAVGVVDDDVSADVGVAQH
jgi:hypothetical protein